MKNAMLKFLLPSAILLVFFSTSVFAATSSQPSYCASGGTVQKQAPWYCNQVDHALANYWAKWGPVALLAVFLSFSIASVIFGAGTMLRSDKIRSFGIGEYYEATASAIIVVAFMFVSAVLFGIIPGIVTGSINPYNTALNYTASTANSINAEVSQLFNIAAVDGFWVNINLEFCGQTPLGSTCPVKNRELGITLNNVQELAGTAVNFLFYVPAISIIDIQGFVLSLLDTEFWILLIFMYIAIPVFLIPGVVLRSILPTRGLGGMMIAIAIGFYMVMPILFSVAYYFTHTAVLQQADQATANLQRYGAGVGAQVNALSPNSPLVQVIQTIQSGMSTYWLAALFYPSLILALTYAIILQIAELIGGMAQLSSRLRVGA